VKQDDFFIHDDEEHPCDAIPKRRPDFPMPSAKRIDKWLPNRPLPLHGEYVGADRFLIGFRLLLQPVAHRFVPGVCFEE
jgi:hypothetical protein